MLLHIFLWFLPFYLCSFCVLFASIWTIEGMEDAETNLLVRGMQILVYF